jgi:phage-related holin
VAQHSVRFGKHRLHFKINVLLFALGYGAGVAGILMNQSLRRKLSYVDVLRPLEEHAMVIIMMLLLVVVAGWLDTRLNWPRGNVTQQQKPE